MSTENTASTGKTVETYLVNGDPQGIKLLSMPNKTCQGLVIPRGLLKQLKNKENTKRDWFKNLKYTSFYILLSPADEAKAYIGQTNRFLTRIDSHYKNKDFWNEAIVFSASDNSLNKADVEYLEYLAITKAVKANVYTLEANKQTPAKPNMPEPQIDAMRDFFEDVKMLASLSNYRLFDEHKAEKEDEVIFYCKNQKGTDAKGVYEAKTFRVLAGSKLRKTVTNSYRPGEDWRKDELSGKTKEEGNSYILTKDIIFSSPSGASSFCLGKESNGLLDWKDKNQNTLKDQTALSSSA